MDNREIAEKLASLAQLDIDAVNAYEQAIKNVEDPDVRGHMTTYRDDHKRHIEELSTEIRSLGGTPPEVSPDFKGFFISGFTSLRSATGTDGALKAMQTNEKLTNKNYQEATKWDVEGKIKTLIEKNYEDERIHLEYIESKV